MDDKSLEMLEFPRVREILAGYTSFPASRELALNLKPVADFVKISYWLKVSGEARQLLALESGFSIGEIADIRETAQMAARGKVLEAATLIEVQKSLSMTRQLRGHLVELAPEFPVLRQIAGGITDLRSVEKAISASIAPTGEVLDDASPELARVRRDLISVRHDLVERLQTILRSPRTRQVIQEPVITEREGRYVIPVKIEAKKDIKGIVHDVSNTGATVFVEPLVAVDMGNSLRELAAQEQYEIEKILGGLSAQVGANQDEIYRNISLASEIDLAIAKARYARRFKAVEPELVLPEGDGPKQKLLKLVNARHPLIGDKAVPLTVAMGKEFSVLVITGPNTGGKTVALKTVGLLCLMTQAGIPIPASPDSVVPVLDNIFADIGDEQSIANTLSTFSWHIGNLVRIIGIATGSSLVLLDELGTSTDPAEGSALARSILRYFLERGTFVVATTHFSELKAFAHGTPGMQNASLDFDPLTLAPTYHLRIGIPGGSNALATASRLGLPPAIVEEARAMLGKGTRELEELLGSLMTEKEKVGTLSADLEKQRSTLETQNIELQTEREALKIRESRIIQEARDRVAMEAAELHRDLRQAASDLRKEKSKERVEQAQRALAAVHERLRQETWKPTAAPAEEVTTVAPGDTVWLKDAGIYATVLSISEDSDEAEVQAGNTRIRLSLQNLEKISQGQPKPITVKPRRTVLNIKSTAGPTLDLRGKRAEEVEPLLDSYIDSAILTNLGEVVIIHGAATGTVRKIVRERLAKHPQVKSFRPGGRGEGGDGVTVVSL